MKESHFVQLHPYHPFSEEDKTDYSEQDKYFIQCLKSMENIMDIDAYIIDYKTKNILYATKGCSIYFGKEIKEHSPLSIRHLDKILIPEELIRISLVNSKVYDFFYSLPINRRSKIYFTQDYKIKARNGNVVLINHRGTILSLTEDGELRLTLCVISCPTSDKVGNSYIKMVDTGTVYEFITSSKKFVEVKTQKLTSKANKIIQLASNGKTEEEIANELKISVNTVKYHKKRIFAQLGVKNTAEAIQWINNQKKLVRKI